MKKGFITLLCLLSVTIFMAQDTNKNDASGQRHGLWKGTYETTKKPRYEGTFDHGKETGTFKFFNDDAKSTLMATRVFAKDGSCYTTFFDPEGKKVSEGREVNHLQEGEWKYYHHASKAIMSTERYMQGKLTGIRKVFFAKGGIAEETTYEDGIKQGIYRKYTEKGIVLEETTYKNNEIDGPAIFRDAEGNIASQGVYTNGLKTGMWKFYEKGKLIKEKNMSERPTLRKKATN